MRKTLISLMILALSVLSLGVTAPTAQADENNFYANWSVTPPIAGIRMQMQENKAVSVTIQGKPIDLTQNYFLLTNDYMANGGDNCSMLSSAPQIALSSTMRDAFINYCRSKNAKNQPINAVKDGRIK